METPEPETVAYYEKAVPADPRARRGQMFGHPCAFVNGNMFFGTFRQSVIARVGAERAVALARGPVRVFAPRPNRVWRDYVQVDAGALPTKKLTAIAVEALDFTDGLPPKRTASKRIVAAKKPAAKKPTAKKPPAKKPSRR